MPKNRLVFLISLFWIWVSAAASFVKGTEPGLLEPDEAWARAQMQRMSLREKVGQLIKLRVHGDFLNRRSEEFAELENQVRRNQIGGLVLFAGNVYESAALLNELQMKSKLPLLVAADFERGASFRIDDTTSFPWTMAIGATGSDEFSYQQGAITAREARALGVHWVYAPVMDVNNNPDNPVINVRSYGEDPKLVARLGSAFIRGCRNNGVLATAKHFPGHGDTSVDSHFGLPVVTADASRLDAIELVPFRQAIGAGVDAIMTAHVAVPSVTAGKRTPATLSYRVLTDLLRKKLKFGGLIVTDAMEMAGVTSRYWTGMAAIRAIQAGADVLLMPPSVDVAINEIVRAVKRGDIAKQRVDQSVKRVLLAKTRAGLHVSRTVALEDLSSRVGRPEDRRLGQAMADRSMTLVRDRDRVLPLDTRRPQKVFSLILSAHLDPFPLQTFQRQLRRRFPAIETASIERRATADSIKKATRDSAASDVIVVATLVRLTSSGRIMLTGDQRAVIRRLFRMKKPIVWVAFGNPYVLKHYPDAPAYLCTFSHADVSQVAAARALTGEIEISGRLPVSIPRRARIGDGIVVPRLNMKLTRASPQETGLRANAFEETRQLLDSLVREGAFPGASVMVGYQGKIVLEATSGKLSGTAGSNRVSSQTIYDLDSLTEGVGTTTAAMMLHGDGSLLLGARVQDYVPEFRGRWKARTTVSHLLAHTSGLPAHRRLYEKGSSYEEILEQVYSVPLEREPGKRLVHSDLGIILLGEILSRTSGRPLDQFLNDSLFIPLGMKSTAYNPPAVWLGRIAPTEKDPSRGRLVHGEVHDKNSFAMGGVSGHAGLFSDAEDLAIFAQMLLNGGVYDHRRYLQPAILARFTGSHPNRGPSMGWRRGPAQHWIARAFSRSAYWRAGVTGAMMCVDPDRRMFLIFLSNAIHSTREDRPIEEARRRIAESIVKEFKK